MLSTLWPSRTRVSSGEARGYQPPQGPPEPALLDAAMQSMGVWFRAVYVGVGGLGLEMLEPLAYGLPVLRC